MNPKIKAQWVAALRSGEYQQGTGRLERNSKFCCLGVLCDLAVKAGIAKRVTFTIPDGGSLTAYETNFADGQTGVLPSGILAWAGLDSRSPEVTQHGILVPLAALNDRKIPFTVIADLIEEQL